MNFFKTKTPLSSKTMTAFIYENVKVRSAEVTPLFDKIGAIYDELENQLVVMAVNYEIMSWELSKSNPVDKVTAVINDVYNKFFSLIKVESSQVSEYRKIMTNAKNKADDILFSKKKQLVPKKVLIYKLILELQGINEMLVDRITAQELEFTIERWLKAAYDINSNYKIVDTKQDEVINQPIDFDF
jgi:hypothetical protein